MIYFDNAATTLVRPPCVGQAVLQAMDSLGNAGRGAHAGALDAARQIYYARCALARLFGCRNPSRVIFTANATEALNMALFGLLHSGDHVIATDLAHNSLLRPLYALEKRGVQLDFCPADSLGRIDYEDIAQLCRPNTRLIACTHGSNLTGNLLDIARIGEFARSHGILLLTDAAQTAGVVPIHMEAMNIDILCFTGHKGLMGPQGTGGLCLSERAELAPCKYGGTGVQSYLPGQPMEYPTRLEAGTLNGHGIAGLLAAVRFLDETGLDTIRSHKLELTRRFYAGASQIPGIRIYGDYSSWDRTPVVSLNVADVPSGEISDLLWEDYEIATRPGAHCAPRLHRALGTQFQGAVRFSFGYYNTAAEVDAALKALEAIAL